MLGLESIRSWYVSNLLLSSARTGSKLSESASGGRRAIAGEQSRSMTDTKSDFSIRS